MKLIKSPCVTLICVDDMSAILDGPGMGLFDTLLLFVLLLQLEVEVVEEDDEDMAMGLRILI